eukprot:scaffold684_cov345-Pavlova_lutheri.AAC.27
MRRTWNVLRKPTYGQKYCPITYGHEPKHASSVGTHHPSDFGHVSVSLHNGHPREAHVASRLGGCREWKKSTTCLAQSFSNNIYMAYYNREWPRDRPSCKSLCMGPIWCTFTNPEHDHLREVTYTSHIDKYND